MALRPLIHLPVLALMAGAALVVAEASAQDLTDRDRIQNAIEVTDQRIQHAQVLVSESDNAEAAMHLEMAIHLQQQAKARFAANELRMAANLTFQARAQADKAIAIVRNLPVPPDADRVRAQLERTQELLERARDRIEDCGVERARAMLHAAAEMQQRAKAAFAEGRYLAALRLTMTARERAMQALRLCRMEDNLREACERALARTDEVLARAHDIVAEKGNEQARQALARGAELQTQAKIQFRAGMFEACLRLTQSARALAYRAIRLADGQS